MSPLSLTVQLYDRETVQSFVSRLGRCNGLSFVQNFCADMGLKWVDVTGGAPEALQTLSYLASVDFDALSQRAVTKMESRRFSLNGQILTHGTLFRHKLRFCPCCLVDDDCQNGALGRFGRLEWQLLAFRVCPVHLMPLATLQSAERPTSPYDFWQRISQNWQRVRRLAEHHQSIAFGTDFETYLIGRLLGKQDETWLGRLELDLVCRLCERLGIVLLFGSKAVISKLTPDELARASALGFQTAKLGRKGLKTAFKEMKNASGGTAKGYLSDFGSFSQWLRPIDPLEPRFSPIIDELTRFIFLNYALEDGQTVLGRTCPRRRVHCLSSAADAVGLDKGRVAKFAAAMGIDNRDHDRGFSIEADKHVQLLDEFASCVTCSEVKERLGLSFEMLDRLSKSGLLTPRFNLSELSPVYHPDDIAEFEVSVFHHATEMEEIPLGYMPLNVLSGHTSSKIEELIRLVQAGRLRTVCFQSGENGLWCLHADPEDVWDQIEIEPPEGFTKAHLKSLVGLTFATSNRLIRAGTLTVKSMRNHRRRRNFALNSAAALQVFLAEHVTLGMLAYDDEDQANLVMAKLKRLGVSPIDSSKGHSKIYLRSAIERTTYPIKSCEQHYSEVVLRFRQQHADENENSPLTVPPPPTKMNSRELFQ